MRCYLKNKPKVLIRAWGGLGNQFFQIILALSIATNRNGKVLVDSASGYIKDKYHRRYMLEEIFNIDAEKVKRPRLYYFLLRNLSKFSKYFSKCYITDSRIIELNSHLTCDSIVCEGYFQSGYDYNKIRRMVAGKIALKSTGKSKSYYRKEVAVHVRITDHASEFCMGQFIKTVIERYGHDWSLVTILTNDIDATRLLLKNFEIKFECIEADELEALNYLAHSQNVIIGYSSFGWMGAFLNKDANVFCPKANFSDLNFVWNDEKILDQWVAVK